MVGTPAPALRPDTVVGRLERSFQELAVMVGCYLEDFRLMLEAANCGMVAVDAADRVGLVEDIARWHRIERVLDEAKLNLPTDPKARRRALEDAIVVALAFSRGDIVPRPIFLPSGQAAERFMRIEGALFEIYGPDWREVMGARKHPDVDRSAAAERGRWLH